MNSTSRPTIKHRKSEQLRQGRSDTPLILGRLRRSKRLISTQVPSPCEALRGGTLQRATYICAHAWIFFELCIFITHYVQTTTNKNIKNQHLGMPPFSQNFLLFYPLVHSMGSMKPDIALNLSLANIPVTVCLICYPSFS